MTRLATPVFNGGPTDNPKIVDVYNTVTPEVRNSLTSKLSAFGAGLDDMLGTGADIIAGIGSRLTNGTMNLAQAKDRIMGALAGSRGDIQKLAQSIQDSLFAELTGLDPSTNYVKTVSNLLNQIKILTSQGERLISGKDFDEVSSVLGFLSDITGNRVWKSFDLGSEAALMTTAVRQISQWGIPELMNEVLDSADPPTRFSIIKRSASTIASSSDAATVAAIIRKGGAAALVSETPNFPETFVTRYQLKKGATPADYPALVTELFEIMDALDPEWFWTWRNGVKVWNLRAISKASKDMLTLLTSNADTMPAALVAPSYKVNKSALSLMKTMYPGIALN